MQKILLVLMLFCCTVIPRAIATVYVMPEQYSFVVSKNGVWGSFEKNNFGNEDKWNKIVLLGRCPDSNVGQHGSWVYGDGNKTGSI